jgi:hypothetical protein
VIREGTLLIMANTVQTSGLSAFSVFLCYDVDVEERSLSWVYRSDMNLPQGHAGNREDYSG